jgi:uncharacterized paraquat-inducible protein A
MLIAAASVALTGIAVFLLALASAVGVAQVVLAWQSRLEPAPKHGPISCDGCSALVACDVRYVGQQMTCSRCGSRLTAPGARPVPLRRSASAVITLAIGLALVLLALGRR